MTLVKLDSDSNPVHLQLTHSRRSATVSDPAHYRVPNLAPVNTNVPFLPVHKGGRGSEGLPYGYWARRTGGD